MKSGENSQAPISGGVSHRFPNLAGGGGTFCREAGASDRDQFQPLFHGAKASSADPALDDAAESDNRRMEQARQRGYDNGFEAGRQDACRMANNLLAPHLDGFRQELERLESYRQNIADHASTHMMKLAVAIAERILGADVHVTVADLQHLRPTLIDAIGKRYQLHLRYHPQDLSDLQHLMACEGENRWRTDSGLSIEKDPDVEQGAMINDREAGKSPSIEEQVQPSLRQLLMKNAPPPHRVSTK
jgi:flagellar biosynthesis/type III secretory pathway protein FliH